MDPAWPKLAAQLIRVIPAAGLACTQLAAALTTEQVLATLAGPQAGLPTPPTWGATLQLDPVGGSLRRLFGAHQRRRTPDSYGEWVLDVGPLFKSDSPDPRSDIL